MLYSDWITRVGALLEVPITNSSSASPSSDPSFNSLYPAAVDYAENRMQRDLDFINTVITDSSASTTANVRKVTLPTDVGTFIVVQQASLIVSGTRKAPIIPVSREFLDYTYPSETALGVPSYPSYWCPNDGVSILIGPSTDTSYPIEFVGTIRLNQLSASNTSNFLSLELPDMYIAASMVFFAQYQQRWAESSQDAQMGLSWEGQYTKLYQSAEVEELRKKFRSIGNSSRIPSPLAGQPGN